MGISFLALLRAQTTQNMKKNMITIEQIRKLLEKATKGKLTIAGGNDVDDYPVCNGLPQQWVYSLVDGVTFAYTPKEEVANLLVRIPEIAQLCLDQAAEIEQLKAEIADRNIEALSQSCPACTKTGNIHINCIMR